ncbi:MAG TPA: lipoyl(octanoyl) transferase LipB [Dehalococcoidia bacterium]|nr:lipoyl(octanoyl) transferase LipB [Dehalococcoidia bacterium]
MDATVRLLRAGLVPYSAASRWQRETATSLRREGDTGGEADEAVALLEHPPVYTLGRRGGRQHVLRSEAELALQGAELVESDRGGDVTFHGPGQLVVYPILDLRARGIAPVDHVRSLEGVVIDVLRDFEVCGERVEGRPGVWVSGAKVAAVGVRVQRGVSTHGLALNVSTDLSRFDAIVPCGIGDAGVTSMQRLLGVAPSMAAVQSRVVAALGSRLGLTFDVERYAEGLRRAG